MDHEARNGTGSNDNEEYTNIYFIVGDRRETATYKANQVTDMELKGERESFIASLAKSFIDFSVVLSSQLFHLFNAGVLEILGARWESTHMLRAARAID